MHHAQTTTRTRMKQDKQSITQKETETIGRKMCACVCALSCAHSSVWQECQRSRCICKQLAFYDENAYLCTACSECTWPLLLNAGMASWSASFQTGDKQPREFIRPVRNMFRTCFFRGFFDASFLRIHLRLS